jgi:hypothetical protein
MFADSFRAPGLKAGVKSRLLAFLLNDPSIRQSRPLWRDQGKHTEARDLLAPIYDWFKGFDTPVLQEAKMHDLFPPAPSSKSRPPVRSVLHRPR